jgi:hypothetical protein
MLEIVEIDIEQGGGPAAAAQYLEPVGDVGEKGAAVEKAGEFVDAAQGRQLLVAFDLR